MVGGLVGVVLDVVLEVGGGFVCVVVEVVVAMVGVVLSKVVVNLPCGGRFVVGNMGLYRICSFRGSGWSSSSSLSSTSGGSGVGGRLW